MNNRDTILYSYLKGKGGSGEDLTPRLIDKDDSNNNGIAQKSITSKTFSVSAGQIMIGFIMHRSTLTLPAGFTAFDSVSNGGQSITIIYKKIKNDAQESYTIEQNSNVRMSACWGLFKNINLESCEKLTDASSSITFTGIQQKRYFVFCSNVYSGAAWETADKGLAALALVSMSDWGANVYANFGTSISTSTKFSNGGNQVMGMLIYLE